MREVSATPGFYGVSGACEIEGPLSPAIAGRAVVAPKELNRARLVRYIGRNLCGAFRANASVNTLRKEAYQKARGCCHSRAA